MNKIRIGLLAAALAVIMISCSYFSMQKADDGSLRVETTLPLQVVTSILQSAVDFTNYVNLQLELRDGYVYVQADSVQFQGITANNVSFHLELAAVNGRLAGTVTQLEVSGSLFDDSNLESYNQMLSEELAQASQQSDQARLEEVSVSPDGIKMIWLLNPKPSD